MKESGIELGMGGLRIVREGVRTLAKDCTNTQSGVSATLSHLDQVFSRWKKITKQETAEITPGTLREKFGNTAEGPALDDNDWSCLAETFASRGRNHLTAKGAAYAYVGRKTDLEYSTLKTLKSRSKGKKRKKSPTDNRS